MTTVQLQPLRQISEMKLMYRPELTSLVAQMVKCLSTMRETWVPSLSREDPLEKEIAIHSSTIVWKIPWTEEPGRLQSMGWVAKSRTRLSDFTFTFMMKKGHLFWCQFQKALLVFIESFNFSFFGISGWGIDLDYCDVEWFALETTEIILSFLRLHPNTAFQTLSLSFFFFF